MTRESLTSRGRGRGAAAAAAHRVLQVRDLDDSVFLVRLERKGLEFSPGQHVFLGPRDSREAREYTIYSSPDEDFIEVLVKEIATGDVSPRLHRCRAGEEILLRGPFGSFVIGEDSRKGRLLFVATGTGVSPFHCFVSSYPDMDYLLLHGVRYPEELCGREAFDPARHLACLTRSNQGQFRGRVSDYLRKNPVDMEASYYLCGGSGMIYEVFRILRGRGVPRERIFTEVYF